MAIVHPCSFWSFASLWSFRLRNKITPDDNLALMSLFTPPPDYPRIKIVNSFHELISTSFGDGINALCWQRELPGDFAEIVRHALALRDSADEGIISLDESWLEELPVTPAGKLAVEALMEDQRQLSAHDLEPNLNCIHAPLRDSDEIIPTDVFSFHVDSAPVQADTWLCTYHGASSQLLRNEQAIRKIDIPELRAALLKNFDGADNAEFEEHLSENCYDLHYALAPDAQPVTFGLHNLWRISNAWPGSPVPPCIHRAPDTSPAGPPRLLLIS